MLKYYSCHNMWGRYFEDFSEPGVRALWRKAVDLGLVVELHIGPEYGLQVAEVLRDMPESVVLIDHLAEAGMGLPHEFATILDLAAFPNVYMKLSGLGHFCDDAPMFESALVRAALPYYIIMNLYSHAVFMSSFVFCHAYKYRNGTNARQPLTRRVIQEFGPHRIVWGSGPPEIVDVHMQDYSPMDRAKVKGGNLWKLLPWPQKSHKL
jgi:predicted TIM-barrel fold metal-dependent hydrolase